MIWITAAPVLVLTTERGEGVCQEVLEVLGLLGRAFPALGAVFVSRTMPSGRGAVRGFPPLPARRMPVPAAVSAPVPGWERRGTLSPVRAHPRPPRRGSPAAAAAPGAGGCARRGAAHGALPPPSPQPRPLPRRAGSGSRACSGLSPLPRWPLPSIARRGGAGPVLTVRSRAPSAARAK